MINNIVGFNLYNSYFGVSCTTLGVIIANGKMDYLVSERYKLNNNLKNIRNVDWYIIKVLTRNTTWGKFKKFILPKKDGSEIHNYKIKNIVVFLSHMPTYTYMHDAYLQYNDNYIKRNHFSFQLINDEMHILQAEDLLGYLDMERTKKRLYITQPFIKGFTEVTRIFNGKETYKDYFEKEILQ